MENLEQEPGFYDNRWYGEFEKHLLHHATVSVLNINIYNSQVIHFNNFFLIKIITTFLFQTILLPLNKNFKYLVFIGKCLYNLTDLIWYKCTV